jgi:hypothetical protein
MSETMFAPKVTLEPGNQRLEVISVEKTETYGPQLAIKLRVVGGEHGDYTFTDYANRDEDTGRINQGSKAWTIYEACLGKDFHEKIKGLDAVVGKEFMARVETTKTGSRNKVEHGTVGPAPSRDEEDDDFNAIPF